MLLRSRPPPPPPPLSLQELTKSQKHTAGGTALLMLDSQEEPYLAGIKVGRGGRRGAPFGGARRGVFLTRKNNSVPNGLALAVPP